MSWLKDTTARLLRMNGTNINSRGKRVDDNIPRGPNVDISTELKRSSSAESGNGGPEEQGRLQPNAVDITSVSVYFLYMNETKKTLIRGMLFEFRKKKMRNT